VIPKHNPAHKGKHAGRLTPAQFRAAVWLRDSGRDRATGEPLSKTDPSPDRLGQVCHLRGRRVMPEWATDPARALLLSDTNHRLSDARGGKLLTLTDPETGEPAEDASRPICFTLRRWDGTVVWRRTR
jgi:hypothetical protein